MGVEESSIVIGINKLANESIAFASNLTEGFLLMMCFFLIRGILDIN